MYGTMQLKDQVTSLTLSKQLKELGVKQNGYFQWYSRGEHEQFVSERLRTPDICSAFTVSELGDLMGYFMRGSYGGEEGWVCKVGDSRRYEDIDKGEGWHFAKADTEANARAKALIWLIENNHVSV